MINENHSKTKAVHKVPTVSIVLDIVLVVIKLLAGILSNSNVLIADAFHSGSDAITSIGVFIGVAMANKPRDDEHHYGHEKIETVTTFLISMAIMYVGLRIGYNAIIAMINSETVIFSYFSLFVACASVLTKEVLYQIAFKIGTQEKCPALIADAWHHRSDALSSIASVIGILGAKYGIYILDALGGLIVAIIVTNVGIKIFIDSFHQLIDVSIHLDKLVYVADTILDETTVIDIGDIRTRRHGSKVLVDIRIFVDSNIAVYEGHQIADAVEDIIRREIEDVKDVIVHVDPHIH